MSHWHGCCAGSLENHNSWLPWTSTEPETNNPNRTNPMPENNREAQNPHCSPGVAKRGDAVETA